MDAAKQSVRRMSEQLASPVSEATGEADDSIISPEERKCMFAESMDTPRRTWSSTTVVMDNWPSHRRMVGIVVKSFIFELIVGAVVLVNVGVVVYSTNLRATCRTNGGSECDDSLELRLVHILLLVLYMLEILARWYVDRALFFLNKWNLSDVIIIGISVFAELLDGVIPSMGYLRVFRIIRLFRSMRLVVVQRELYIIVHGFVGTMKALFWAALLMLGLFTMWSILAVEVLHPINRSITKETDVYKDCPRCAAAYSSVWKSNLTFFYTVVLGDDWSEVVLPVIEYNWWTIFLFMGVTFSVGLGLTNLILAVIVDRAREAHEDDVNHQNHLKDKKMQTAKRNICKMCKKMDLDKSGTLSLQELLRGFDESADFRSVLTVLDVEKDDMECVFHIMDSDGSGDVSYDEFVDNLYKMKAQNSRTLLVFIKFYVLELRRNVEEQLNLMKGETMDHLKMNTGMLARISRNFPDTESATVTEKARVSRIPSKSVLRSGADSPLEMCSFGGDEPLAMGTIGQLHLQRAEESDRKLNQLLESSDDMLRTLAANDSIAATNGVLEVGTADSSAAYIAQAIPGMPFNTSNGAVMSPKSDAPPEAEPSPPKAENLQQQQSPQRSPPELGALDACSSTGISTVEPVDKGMSNGLEGKQKPSPTSAW